MHSNTKDCEKNKWSEFVGWEIENTTWISFQKIILSVSIILAYLSIYLCLLNNKPCLKIICEIKKYYLPNVNYLLYSSGCLYDGMQTYHIILLQCPAVRYKGQWKICNFLHFRSITIFHKHIYSIFRNIIEDMCLCYGYNHNKNWSNLPCKHEYIRKIF